MLLWTIAILGVFCAGEIDALCETVKAPMCSNMPYNLTKMPNSFHHSTQDNAQLAIEQYQALVNTGCSQVLSFFLCTMYFPICTKELDSVLQPCKSLCEEAKAGCLPIMLRYNVSWPDNLACEKLPEYSQGLCVTPSVIINDPTSKPPADLIAPEVQPERRRPNRNRNQRRRKPKNKDRPSKQERRREKQQKKQERQQRKKEKRQERMRRRQERRDNRAVESDLESATQKQEVTPSPSTDVSTSTGTGTGTSTGGATAPCVCPPPGQIKRQLKTNSYSYKIKASWSGLERSSDGSTLMKFKLMDTFSWPDEGYPDNGATITLRTSKTCICPRFKDGRAYLVAGYGSGPDLSFDVALKWKPMLKRLVDKDKGKPNKKGRNVRKQQRQKPQRRRKPERRVNKNEKRRNRKERGRQNSRKNGGNNEQKRGRKGRRRAEKERRKEGRKEKRKERRQRRKWGTTSTAIPALDWTTTTAVAVQEGAKSDIVV